MKLFTLWGELALKGVEQVQDDIDDTADHAEDAQNTMTEAFKKIGGAVAAYLTVDAIKDFGAALVEASSEVSAEVSAFEQIMGDYTDGAKTKMNEIADATGVVSSRLTPYMTSMTAKFKGLGYDIETATTLATDGLTLASDAAAFWDKSLDESMGHLNSFINGSYEGGEAIGLFANDTQMAAYAVKQGIVEETKAWSSLDEATKQATRLEYAKLMFEQSGATGQAAKEADQYANVQANLTEKWRQFKALIGEPLLQNVVIPAMQVLSGLVTGLSNGYQALTTWMKENETAVQLIGIAIGTLTTAIIAFNIAQKAATIATKLHAASTAVATAATTAWGTVMAFVTSPITLVIAAIGALIAIVILMAKNWDTVKEKTQEVWGVITEVVSKAWDTIKNAVTVGIMFIKELFNAAFQILTIPFRFIWENCKESILEFINKVKKPLTDWFNGMVEKFNTFKANVQQIMQNVKSALSNIWNNIKDNISNVINSIKSTVSNVFNSVKSTVSNIFNGIKSTASSVWNSIKAAIEGPINTAKETVRSVIEAIKGFFNFSWSLPKLKMPHVSIVGEFSLVPPSVPRFNIDWYAKAMDNPMILDSPTIFGAQGGKLLGAGEAGAEVVAGRDTLMDMIQNAVNRSNERTEEIMEKTLALLAMYMPQIAQQNPQLILDTGVLVGELAPKFDRELGQISRLKERGR